MRSEKLQSSEGMGAPARAPSASEEARRLTSALAEAGIGVWHLERNSGRVTWNGRVGAMLGLAEDLRQSDLDAVIERVPEEDREHVRIRLQAALLTGTYDAEHRFLHGDGSTRWMRTCGSTVRTEAGDHCYTGILIDITDGKRLEEDLRQSREQLATIFNQAVVGIMHRELAGRMLMVNRRFCEIVGRSADELAAAPSSEFVDPADLARHEDLYRKHIATGEPFVSEKRYVRPDGGVVWCEVHVSFVCDTLGEPASAIIIAHDISERKAAEQALHDSRALSHGIVEASSDCIALLDLDGTILFINDSGLRAIEIDDPASLLGRTWSSCWRRAKRADVTTALEAARRGGTGRFYGQNPTAKGTSKSWDVAVTPVLDEAGRPKQILTIARDVTEHRDAILRMRWNANHDVLTHLPNRGMFQERLQAIVAEGDGRGRTAALLLLDLDRFKEVNDSLGHAAGDFLLQGFGARLRRVVADDDMVARLGGDEFAIILDAIAGEAEVRDCVARLIAELAEPLTFEGREIDFRVSIGAALFPRDGQESAELLKSADLALYSAKEGSNGKFVMFERALQRALQSRASMIDFARAALAENRIFPFYQPKVRLDDGSVAGFEALLRWRDDAGAVREPAAIAAALEEADTVWPIGRRMRALIIADMRRWRAAGLDFGHVAINAAAPEFRYDDYAETLLAELAAGGIPSRCVELEVTEAVFMGAQAEKVSRALHLLHESGVRIALDDFGTGFSSLSHLKEFPVDVLKIDRSFIANVQHGKELAIVGAVLNLGRSLDIAVVAEGIETEEQAVFLREQGCELGQGYLYGRPASSDAVPEWIGRRGTFRARG